MSTGQTVFLRDCAWCHGDEAEGTKNAPSLVGVGQRAVDFYLRTGQMPLSSPDARLEPGPPAYDSRTISAIVKYVGTLAGGPDVPAVAPGDPVRGRTLFLENCAACHSGSGTGAIVAQGMRAPSLWHTASEQIAEAIRVGPGPMPRFSQRQLDEKDADDIASYVQKLGPSQNAGGLGLDQYGPVVEGAVGLLGLLTVLLLLARFLGKRAPR